MGELLSVPPTSVVLGSIVSENVTPVASAMPVLEITTVYMIVSPGLAFAGSTLGRLSVLVAVIVGPAGLAGETADANRDLASKSPTAPIELLARFSGGAGNPPRAAGAPEAGISDELGDTERAEAISMINAVRHRIKATEF